MRLVALILATIFLAACSSNPKVQYRQLTEPDIGNIVTANVGDSLVQQADGHYMDALIFTKDQYINGYVIKKGMYFPDSEKNGYVYYRDVKISSSGESKNKYDELYYHGPDKVCLKKNDLCGKTDGKIESAVKLLKSSGFQQTLLYNGKVGNKINIGYREFMDKTARPAFSNSVEYDLGESQIIGYKGARLEIISANTVEIKYKVLKGFD